MAKTITRGSSLIGIRVPPWATFVRGIYPGLLPHLHRRATWRLETTEDSTNEIPPVVIDLDWTGDGLIVFRCTAEELHAWHSRGIRVVSISSEIPAAELPTVVPDNRAIGRLAAEHLMARGLRRFAFWLDPDRTYARQRRDGFVETLEKAGHEVEIVSLATSRLRRGRRWSVIERTVKARMVKGSEPLGLFAKDDISAAAIVRCCQGLGFRVPEDVAVIGCNNDPAFVFTTMPGLTSVAYPGRGVGAAAVELLDRMLESPTWQPEGPWLIPPGEVVERSSTAVFDFEDPLIGRVWRWIQDHPPDRPARVADLARALSVAEATLRRRFRRATGKTVKATLDEHRWRRIGEELKRGNDSIKRIAYRFGFTSPEELSRFVKRCTGDSPSLWRSRNRSAT